MTYFVDQIETPDGVFYTSRNDTRNPEDIVRDGITGFEKTGIRSKIYTSLKQTQTCKLNHRMKVLEGKSKADAIKKSLIEWRSSVYGDCLNSKK